LRTTAQGEPPLDEADLAGSEHHGRYLRLGETFERVSATLIARHGAPATSRREGLGETAPRDSFPGEVVRLSAEQSWLLRADARLVLRVNDWVDEFFERCGVLATILERT